MQVNCSTSMEQTSTNKKELSIVSTSLPVLMAGSAGSPQTSVISTAGTAVPTEGRIKSYQPKVAKFRRLEQARLNQQSWLTQWSRNATKIGIAKS